MNLKVAIKSYGMFAFGLEIHASISVFSGHNMDIALMKSRSFFIFGREKCEFSVHKRYMLYSSL